MGNKGELKNRSVEHAGRPALAESGENWHKNVQDDTEAEPQGDSGPQGSKGNSGDSREGKDWRNGP